jgi:hypothetical protein
MTAKELQSADLSSEQLITSHVIVSERFPSLENVYIATYGVYLCWIIEYYQDLKPDEENKIGKTAKEFYVPEQSIEASLAYYHRQKPALDARILLNKAYYNPDIASQELLTSAQVVLDKISGIIDPLLLSSAV